MSEQHVFTSPYNDEPPVLDNLSLTSYSLQNAYALGDKPAFIQEDKTLNYNQLPSLVFRISRNLTAHGVQPNDVVLIHLPNNLYYGVLFHGVLVAGAITSTCNPTYNEEELEHQIRTSKSTVIVTLGLFLEKVKRTVANIPEVKKIFAVGDISPDFADVLPFAALLAPVADEPEVIDIASFTPPGFDSRKQLAALPFSSGTTGLAKAVKLTHHNIAINVWQVVVSEREVTSSDTLIGILPLFHIYGLTLILNFSFLKGCTVVIMPRFDKNVFLDNIQKHKVTYLHIVPPIVLLLAKDPEVLKFDFSHVKCVFSGAAPLGQDLEKALKVRFPEIVVKQAYGMTELSPATTICPLSDPRPGSIGVLLPLVQARLISSETKLPVQVGEPGELLIKGPNVMVGYLDNDVATRETIDEEGWLHTGDVATVDADGFFTIVDRVKELIKYKGFQVPPAELEAILQKHQDVADAAVIGVADDEAGELPRAFVVLRAGATITPQELTDYCNSHLSHYKWIRAGLFPIPSIPRSSAGKILRKELRKLNVEQ